MAVDPARIDRILRSLVAASHGEYDVRVPLEEIDDNFLEVEVGVNYLLDELIARRDQNLAQREALVAQSRQIAAQTAALVDALSTPIIVVWPGVLALPIIGRVDSDRAVRINTTLLARVASERASHVILDLTGVETVDTTTVLALLHMIRAIGLLGALCFVTGISSRGAQQIVELGGTDSKRFRSLARVSDALALVLHDKRALR